MMSINDVILIYITESWNAEFIVLWNYRWAICMSRRKLKMCSNVINHENLTIRSYKEYSACQALCWVPERFRKDSTLGHCSAIWNGRGRKNLT